MGLIGFGKDIEKSLFDTTSPFVFSTVNERTPDPSQRLPILLHHLFLRLERGTRRDLVRHRVAQFDRMAGITQSMAGCVELLLWSAGGLAGACQTDRYRA